MGKRFAKPVGARARAHAHATRPVARAQEDVVRLIDAVNVAEEGVIEQKQQKHVSAAPGRARDRARVPSKPG